MVNLNLEFNVLKVVSEINNGSIISRSILSKFMAGGIIVILSQQVSAQISNRCYLESPVGVNLDLRELCGDTSDPNDHQSSIYQAARSGNVNQIEQLLAQEINVNQRNQFGQTPLYLAARYGHQEIVKRLLNAGANIEVKEENGRTPLYIASGWGNAEVVKELLVAGAEVNTKTYKHWTPLHNASKHGHLGIVKQLLGAGARINATTNQGFTPLDLATNEDIKKVLVNNIN